MQSAMNLNETRCGVFPETYALSCLEPAILRAKIHHHDGSIEEIDLCPRHAKIFGREYPDCIETVRRYHDQL